MIPDPYDNWKSLHGLRNQPYIKQTRHFTHYREKLKLKKEALHHMFQLQLELHVENYRPLLRKVYVTSNILHTYSSNIQFSSSNRTADHRPPRVTVLLQK
jgi:hypothetical protein